MDLAMDEYLKETGFFDFRSPTVQGFVEQYGVEGATPTENMIALYYGVRDAIPYNPYIFSPHPDRFKASDCLAQGSSYCIPKAILLGACARAIGVPSRLGLADVKNHLSSPALIEWLQSDVFVMHGYIELWLNGQWIKATPAFDQTLCDKLAVPALEFDGLNDSIFHPFTSDGEKHMEYLTDHGTFADVPHGLIVQTLAQAYPHLINRFVEQGASRQLIDEI